MTREELHEWLDERFAEVIEEAKTMTLDMDPIERVVTITGLLLATGVHLAAKHGAPRPIVEQMLRERIEDAYRKET